MPPIRRSRALLLVCLTIGGAACATSGASIEGPLKDLGSRAGAPTRPTLSRVLEIPAAVNLDDGLSRDEAVAVALWNSPTFQISLSQLGFANADLVEAGLLSNPMLSLLFPIGPKQLEATLRLPTEILWERPRRVAMARHTFDAAGQTLVQSGLDLVLNVRLAYADLALVRDRLTLAREAASALARIDTLSQSRLRAGDIAELDARAAHIDAVRAAQDADRLVHDVTLAQERLRQMLGLGADAPALAVMQPSSTLASPDCGPESALVTRALSARPDMRAAELTVEAAAARIGWERSRVMALTAVLDANGRGRDGFEMGPGLDASLPLFNRNQGGKLRAQAEMQRASAAYVALQRQIVLDVREASAQLAQASESRAVWTRDILGPLDANLADAEASYHSGESSYLFVLESTRRVIDARLRAREIDAEAQRAVARLERAVGMNCVGGTE